MVRLGMVKFLKTYTNIRLENNSLLWTAGNGTEYIIFIILCYLFVTQCHINYDNIIF